jgi:hypothetical protein
MMETKPSEPAPKPKQPYVPPTLHSAKVFLPMLAEASGNGNGGVDYRKPFRGR